MPQSSYTYNDGDGLGVIDKTLPNGAVEPVSNLDDALKQVKAWMKDATAGAAKIRADGIAATAAIVALDTRADDLEELAELGDTAITALEVAQAATDASVAAILATSGGAPINLIAIMGATQDFIQNAALAVVNFSVASVNPGGGFNTSTKVYTVPFPAGLFQVNASLQISTASSSSPVNIIHYLTILVNGIGAGTFSLPVGTSTSTVTLAISRLFQLASTNTLAIHYQVTTDSGTITTRVASAATGTIFQAARVSA